ncbi:MAG: hypothetical protein EOO07_34155 [Chitinophagaceae bacterium]|nr:MAG: hypothetical protein EOO07_34155 [Chitinophagaceae bacterium]
MDKRDTKNIAIWAKPVRYGNFLQPQTMLMENFAEVFRVSFKHGQPNPLNIQVDHPLYGGFHLPDMTKTFENDIIVYWEKFESRYNTKCSPVTLLRYYFFDLLIEFRDKANGVLPAQIVDDVFRQVIQAYRNVVEGDPEGTIKIVRQHVSTLFYDPDIVNDTKRYMRTLN